MYVKDYIIIGLVVLVIVLTIITVSQEKSSEEKRRCDIVNGQFYILKNYVFTDDMKLDELYEEFKLLCNVDDLYMWKIYS